MRREHVDSRKLRVVTHHYPENTSLEPAQHAPGHCIRENNHAICLVQHSFHPGKPLLRTAWPTCSNRFALLSSSPARRHRLLVLAEPRNAHPHTGHCLRSQPAALSHATTCILPGTHSDAKTHSRSSKDIPSPNLHGDRGTPRCAPWAPGVQQGSRGCSVNRACKWQVRDEKLTLRACSCRQTLLLKQNKQTNKQKG